MFQLNPFLKDFWRTRKPYKLLKGGRFSSKTQDAAGMAAFLARNYSLKFLCIRQFQNRIADSVYTVIKQKIEAAGWSKEFDIGVSSIKHKTTGSEFLFYGIARNLTDIKGTEGVDICWIEEGEGLSEEQWDVIDPTIRKEGAEIWLLWNPHLTSDFVQTKLPVLLDGDCIIKHINYDQNPFLAESAKAKAERLKERDYEKYRHIYLGEPLSDNDRSIIKLSWIEAAIGFDLKPQGRRVIGYDVADEGEDANAVVHAHGSYVYDCSSWRGMDVIESARKVYDKAKSENAEIVFDSIGVGAGSKAEFRQLGEKAYFRINATGFNAGGAVFKPKAIYEEGKTNGDHFANIKAQAWFMLADRFYKTYRVAVFGDTYPEDELISISPDLPSLEELKFELAAPYRDFDNNMRVKVESKKDMKKRGIKSPNIADALVMCYAPNTNEGFTNLFGS